MNSSDSRELTQVTDVLKYVRAKGVRLWSENGQLHYKAPKGTLTREEIERLRASKDQIVALLESTDSVGAGQGGVESFRRAPMAFSQLAHWNLFRLSERRSIRQIASATRLSGLLDMGALRESIAEVVRRHDALRTRVVIVDATPVQEITKSGAAEMTVEDLTALSEGFREVELRRLIDQFILEPVDVSVGPLFGVRLFKLRDDEHVLVMAMEHMISDGASRTILLHDVFTAYMKISNGLDVTLPDIPLQFADYAVRQRNAQASWIKNHATYLEERLTGCRRLRFPEGGSLPNSNNVGWQTVPLRIDRDMKAELREWCRSRRTTPVMSVLTAYVGLVLRWCETSESVVRYVSDGRDHPEIVNTIGFFASVLHLRVGFGDEDDFVALLDRVTEEYCKAHEHSDSSYMAAQVPRPDFTKNTGFNWIPQGSKTEVPNLAALGKAMVCSPINFAHPMRKTLDVDLEPYVLLVDSKDEIAGDVHFPRNRFSVETMERFARNFLWFIETLLRKPQQRIRDILFIK